MFICSVLNHGQICIYMSVCLCMKKNTIFNSLLRWIKKFPLDLIFIPMIQLSKMPLYLCSKYDKKIVLKN